MNTKLFLQICLHADELHLLYYMLSSWFEGFLSDCLTHYSCKLVSLFFFHYFSVTIYFYSPFLISFYFFFPLFSFLSSKKFCWICHQVLVIIMSSSFSLYSSSSLSILFFSLFGNLAHYKKNFSGWDRVSDSLYCLESENIYFIYLWSRHRSPGYLPETLYKGRNALFLTTVSMV